MTLNTAVFAPMPSASERIAAPVSQGYRRQRRQAYRTSSAKASNEAPTRWSRTASFTRSMPPVSISARRRATSGVAPSASYRAASSSTQSESSRWRSASIRSRWRIDRIQVLTPKKIQRRPTFTASPALAERRALRVPTPSSRPRVVFDRPSSAYTASLVARCGIHPTRLTPGHLRQADTAPGTGSRP